MNERETESVIERRLRAWLAAEAPASAPDELRRSVAAIPATVRAPWSERLSAALGWRPVGIPRPVWLLLVAALLLALVGSTAFIGARLLESRPLPPRDPNALVPTAAPSTLPTPSPTPFVGATVLTITCDGAIARLKATAVRAMSDGVHVDAFATDGSPATVDVWAEDHQSERASTRGAAALVLAPGPYQVACPDASAGDGPAVSFVIGDPDRLWKSSDITCANGSGTAGSGDLPPASPAAAIAYLRTIVQLQPGDILEPAGYPEAPSGWIRLVRDGQVVASWQVQGTGDAVSVNSTRHCPEPTSPTPSPAPLSSWEAIGTIPVAYLGDAEGLGDVVGFAKGYVAVFWTGKIWFSSDGRSWRGVDLPFKVGAQGRGVEVRGVTTNGTQVLVVGGYSHAPCKPATVGGGPPCPSAPLSWISEDGLTWRSGYPGPQPPDPSGFSQGSEFVAAWPAGTGWDAALSYFSGASLMGRGLWHSVDGTRWTEVVPAPALTGPGIGEYPWVHAGVADAQGNRVVWQVWRDYTTPFSSGEGRAVTTLATSGDMQTWTELKGFDGREAEISTGAAPVAGRSTRWVLGGASGMVEAGTSNPTVWTSEDLARWTVTPLPSAAGAPKVHRVLLADRGFVAVWASWDASRFDHATWLSADGLTWTALPPSDPAGADFGPGVVADGPAGVIGIGSSPTDSEHQSTVWLLR